MKQKIRFALANLYGPYIVIGIFLVQIFNLFSTKFRNLDIFGDLMLTIRWQVILFYVILPVIAGVVAIDSAKFSKLNNSYLSKLNNREYLWIFFWSAVIPAVSWLIIPIIEIIVGKSLNPFLHAGSSGGYYSGANLFSMLFALLLQSLTILWFGVLGLTIGKFFSVGLSGIIALIVGLVLNNVLTNINAATPSWTFLGDTGASVPQISLGFNIKYLIVQFLALLITGILLFYCSYIFRGSFKIFTKKSLIFIIVIVLVILIPTQHLKGNPHVYLNLKKDQVASVKLLDNNSNSPVFYYYNEHQKFASPYLSFFKTIYSVAEKKGYLDILPKELFEGWPDMYLKNKNTASIGDLTDPLDQSYVLINYIFLPASCAYIKGNSHFQFQDKQSYWNNIKKLAYTIFVVANLKPNGTLANSSGYDFDFIEWRNKHKKILTPKQALELRNKMIQCDFN
jgi:hypothetical protein